MSHPVHCLLCGACSAWYSSFQFLVKKGDRFGIDIYSCDACKRNYYMEDNKIIICEDASALLRDLNMRSLIEMEKRFGYAKSYEIKSICKHNLFQCSTCTGIAFHAFKMCANDAVNEIREKNHLKDEKFDDFFSDFNNILTRKADECFSISEQIRKGE
jgi:hypothetical protein